MADQGAHIYDSIHLIRGVGFPVAVNAFGWKSAQCRGRHAGNRGGGGGISRGFSGCVYDQLCGHALSQPAGPTEPVRWRRSAHGRRPGVPFGLQAGRAGNASDHRRQAISRRPAMRTFRTFWNVCGRASNRTARSRKVFRRRWSSRWPTSRWRRGVASNGTRRRLRLKFKRRRSVSEVDLPLHGLALACEFDRQQAGL